MNQRLDILCAETNGQRTFWTRVGTAFPTKDGKGYRLLLKYMPTSPDANLMMLPVKAQETPQVTDDEFNDPSFPFQR